MDEPSILNELRSSILAKTGIRNITPSDCKGISAEISRTVNKTLSETTIKRLFGFAVVKHKFSKFTLNTLIEYIQIESPLPAVHLANNESDRSDFKWLDVQENALRVTDFTIKSIKNRSGIPYEMTVSRRFAENDLNDFLRSDAIFTAFISHPGYGKTILLSHLAENLLAAERTKDQSSTLIFLTVFSLFNKQNLSTSFESRLKTLLGITDTESLIELAYENFRQSGEKLIIFLDGFSEMSLARELKKQLFEEIIDFICAIGENSHIKLVMSMRSTTWTRFFDHMRYSAFLKKKWFSGNYFNVGDVSNVPPLTEREVDSIMSKISLRGGQELSQRLKSQLKYPFHIELYYQLKEEDPHFKYSTNITFYELVSRFIQDKIYKSNYYTEKILFLKRIIQLTNYGKTRDTVPKDDLIRELSAFKNAYSELLTDGILMEEKSAEEFHPREYVRFIHPHIFEYFLFIELLEKFNLVIDGTFFDYLGEEYRCNHSKFQILQWTIRFMIKTGDFESLISVFKLEMSNYERNYLILFIAENLDYKVKHSPDKPLVAKLNQLHDALIKQLIYFDFVDSCYKAAIQMLVQVAKKESHLLIYNALLSIFALLNVNTVAMKERLDYILSLSPSQERDQFIAIISAAYDTMTGAKKKHDVVIDDLKNNITIKAENEALEIIDAIPLVIAAHSGLLIHDAKSLSLFDTIANRVKNGTESTEPHTLMINSITNLAKVIYNSPDLHDITLDTIEASSWKFKVGSYTEAIAKLTKSFQLKHAGDYNAGLQYAVECLQIFKGNELNINALITYDLIIDLFKSKNDTVKQSEYVYEKLCFLEDNNIPASRFNPHKDKNV